ncbi:unnamed protein product [Diamesa hyperborea]
MKYLVVIFVGLLVQNTLGLNSSLVKDQYNDGINKVLETINQQIPHVAESLFDGFVRLDESINGLRSNCNEIVTQILKSYQVDNLVVFNQDVEIELQSVLELFESFYDRKATNEIVGKYFTESLMSIKIPLSKRIDQLINSIDSNEKAYQCFVNANNDSIPKMFVVCQEDIIQVADIISKTIKDETINLQKSITLTTATMKIELESCLNNVSTSVSCLNNYVSNNKVFGEIDNYRSNVLNILMKLLVEFSGKTEMIKEKMMMMLTMVVSSVDKCANESLN